MRIMVQKFGGTSLSTVQAREHVLRHVKRELEAGLSLVIVVSAMGRRGGHMRLIRCWTGLHRTETHYPHAKRIYCCAVVKSYLRQR